MAKRSGGRTTKQASAQRSTHPSSAGRSKSAMRYTSPTGRKDEARERRRSAVSGGPFGAPERGSSGDFLHGLLPHWFCISCLAKLSEQPERPIREALQALTNRLESRADECWNCAVTGETYRLHERTA
jgi:hypothetical protein